MGPIMAAMNAGLPMGFMGKSYSANVR
jgi:hypothetical protein